MTGTSCSALSRGLMRTMLHLKVDMRFSVGRHKQRDLRRVFVEEEEGGGGNRSSVCVRNKEGTSNDAVHSQ